MSILANTKYSIKCVKDLGKLLFKLNCISNYMVAKGLDGTVESITKINSSNKNSTVRVYL